MTKIEDAAKLVELKSSNDVVIIHSVKIKCLVTHSVIQCSYCHDFIATQQGRNNVSKKRNARFMAECAVAFLPFCFSNIFLSLFIYCTTGRNLDLTMLEMKWKPASSMDFSNLLCTVNSVLQKYRHEIEKKKRERENVYDLAFKTTVHSQLLLTNTSCFAGHIQESWHCHKDVLFSWGIW